MGFSFCVAAPQVDENQADKQAEAQVLPEISWVFSPDRDSGNVPEQVAGAGVDLSFANLTPLTVRMGPGSVAPGAAAAQQAGLPGSEAAAAVSEAGQPGAEAGAPQRLKQRLKKKQRQRPNPKPKRKRKLLPIMPPWNQA